MSARYSKYAEDRRILIFNLTHIKTKERFYDKEGNPALCVYVCTVHR
jgi:hypothetical protein